MGARGGKREGAGRKKRERLTDAGVARRVLAQIEVEKKWLALLNAEEDRVRLDTLKYLTDRDEGKAREALDLNANVRIDDARRQHVLDLIARLARKSHE